MTELKALICRSSGCHYFDGFECTRSDVASENDEKMPCDIFREKPFVESHEWEERLIGTLWGKEVSK